MVTKLVEGVPVDPKIPDVVWTAPNEKRHHYRRAWRGKPFIQTVPNPYFPSGIRFDVFCLEDETLFHPAIWGMFGTLEEAIQRAKEGPPWLR